MTPTDLSSTQETVLVALKECVAFEGRPVTAREVSECLVEGLGGVWYQSYAYDALSRLALKGLVRRAGWSGTARTWEPTGRA